MIILAGWFFGRQERGREQKMNHMPREEEEKIRCHWCIKNESGKQKESAHTVIEHFRLHLDLICIEIHNHVDWLMATMELENIQILSGNIRHLYKNGLRNKHVTLTQDY